MLAACMLAFGGEPGLPAFFSDHMVLQRETRVPLWGTAAPGEHIEVSPEWRTEPPLVATADAAGRWRVDFDTPATPGPYKITIVGAGGTRVLSDVAVGEVWLASGQSNMEWTLGPVVGNGVEGWEEAAAGAADPGLRFFGVENALAGAPLADVAGRWVPSDPESARAFSAVAFFFARKLRAELGVPVGVISSEWGGTPAEAWTRAEGLAPFAEFQPALERLRAAGSDPAAAAAARAAELTAWWRALAVKDPVDGALASTPLANDGRPWSQVSLPATWEQHGLADFDGLAWYKRTLEVPAAWAGKELVLELGPIDDRDTLWWNGARIGGHEDDGQWQTPRVYRIPGERVRAGVNGVAVRVLDTGGLGGFHGSAADMRLRLASGDAAPVSVAGNWAWQKSVPMAELGWPPARQASDPGTPSVLWNGMIAPLVPSAICGVIWYQGESNRERAEQYRRLFPALIQDWRAAFGRGDFPFYFVQLAPFGYPGDTGEAARVRDAQRLALALPNTGMAVTMDIGDPADIHPLKKREVGERLALWALAKTYGRAGECSGPLYRASRIEKNFVRVQFDHAAGLTSHGEPVRCVTIAGADRVFHPAEARIRGEGLAVSSPSVPVPVAVRFGWGAADKTNLWNAAGLPAASFRTDDWP